MRMLKLLSLLFLIIYFGNPLKAQEKNKIELCSQDTILVKRK